MCLLCKFRKRTHFAFVILVVVDFHDPCKTFSIHVNDVTGTFQASYGGTSPLAVVHVGLTSVVSCTVCSDKQFLI